MKEFLTAFVFLLCLVSIASAEELITGAFGIKLGEPLDLNSVQGEIFDTGISGILLKANFEGFSGGKTAIVKPKYPNNNFNYYRVYLTPINKMVVGIQAFGKNSSCASPESRGLKVILSEKYGKIYSGFRRNLFTYKGTSIFHSDWGDSKGRSVMLGCKPSYKKKFNFSELKPGVPSVPKILVDKNSGILTILYIGTKKEVNEIENERGRLDIKGIDPSGL